MAESITPSPSKSGAIRTRYPAMERMAISSISQLKTCLEAANHFLLSEDDACAIFGHLEETIEQYWDAICKKAELSNIDKKLLWGKQFLNPYSLVTKKPTSAKWLAFLFFDW
jgi:serine/threonine-protein kinase HipA